MNKKLKIIPILALIILGFSVVIPANTIFTNKICAADVVKSGNSCEIVPADCPTPGYVNMSTANLQYFGMSVSNLNTSIDATEGYKGKTTADMCIPKDIKQIIEVWVGNTEQSAQGLNYLARFEYRVDVASAVVNFIPKACPPSWQAQQIPVAFPGWSKPYACCPKGYNAVGNSTQSAAIATQGSICCRPGRGGEKATYWNEARGCAYDSQGDGYFASNGQIDDGPDSAPWSGVNPPDYTGSFDQLNQDIANGNGPESIKMVTGGGPAQYPTLGVPLGPSSSVGLKAGTRTGSANKCPPNSQCTIQQGGTINDVQNPNIYDSAGASCGKCFTNGDVIGTSTAASGTPDDPATPNVDESVGFVRYCDSTANATKPYRDETLIGTPDITNGYLLEDSTNKALYKQCFDTGGIYTAIGCIDPTPTGIITGLIRIALGIMGGVALLQLIYVGILYQQGNTEKIKGARTQLIATITGIAVLVFSVLILRIIGVNILDVVSNGSV